MLRMSDHVSDAHEVLSELLKMEAAVSETYLRSTMTDKRLNNLCLLAMEWEMSNDLLSDPTSVIDKFALLGNRRLTLV